MRNKILLKLAFIAFSAPQFALAGSDNRDKNPETSLEMREIYPPSPGSGELLPTDPRTVGEAPTAAQESFERVPSEIIRLILEGLSKPDLKNLRLVEKKLRDVVTSFLTDIQIPRNIPTRAQAEKFFQDLATVKFWEGEKPSEAFINLFRNAPIKGLELGGKKISASNLKTLLPALPSVLERLFLFDNNIGDKEAESVAQHLPVTLQELYLYNNNIGAEGAKALADKLPGTLHALDLSKNNIGTEGAKALAEKLPSTLKGLHLSQNNIADEGAKALADKLPGTLRALYLNQNNIGAEGVKALAGKLPSTLQALHLSQNNIADEGVKALADKLPGTLRILHLSQNNIGTEGAKALAEKLPAGLLYFSLDGNEIGEEGLRALLGVIPKTALQRVTISVPKTSPLREQFKNLRNRKGGYTITFK